MAKKGLAKASGEGTEETMFELSHALRDVLFIRLAQQHNMPSNDIILILLERCLLFGSLAPLIASGLPCGICYAARGLANRTGDFAGKAVDAWHLAARKMLPCTLQRQDSLYKAGGSSSAVSLPMNSWHLHHPLESTTP